MRGRKLTEDQLRLIKRFYDEGFSCKRISKALGIAVGAVFNHLKEENRVRESEEAIALMWQSLPADIRERRRLQAKNRVITEELRARISEARKIHTQGHRKKRNDGYWAVYFPDHPDSTKDGYVMEHRLIMENHIGRRLTKDEAVHHINRNRADNRIENLALMTKKEHMSLHMKERHQKRRKEKEAQT